MEASAVPREAPAGVPGFVPPHVLRLAPDAHLVALIRQGRDAAFEIAYLRHRRGIHSFCRRLLGDAEEAEDAVQQTFLAAYSDLISSDKPIQLRAWLFTIARNRCYSMLRARREQPVPEFRDAPTEALAVQVQRRQDLWDLVRDMRRLPAEQRTAIVLAEVDALSHEQIAHVLSVPREKVKALVFQARESLLASRTARETECSEIRAELATKRGGALRRTNLRRHLRDCAGCREFRREVERHRRRLGSLGALVPLPAFAMKGSLLKSTAGVILAGVGTAGTIVAAGELHLMPGGTPLTPHRVTAHQLADPLPHRSALGGLPVGLPASIPALSARSLTAASPLHPFEPIVIVRRPAPIPPLGGSTSDANPAPSRYAAASRSRPQPPSLRRGGAGPLPTVALPAPLRIPPVGGSAYRSVTGGLARKVQGVVSSVRIARASEPPATAHPLATRATTTATAAAVTSRLRRAVHATPAYLITR